MHTQRYLVGRSVSIFSEEMTQESVLCGNLILHAAGTHKNK